MTALLALGAQLLGAVVSFFRALPAWVRSAALVFVAMIFFYEGVSVPTVWPLSLLWSGSIVDGRVDRVREAADARCDYRIQKSIEAATKTDSDINTDRMREAQAQLEAANDRALAAQQRARDAENDIELLAPEIQTCRKANDRDAERLRR